MRIIAGEYGGRRLVVPRGSSTRPTADRVKEALFSILGAPRRGEGRAVFRALDLYAGSGALALEAISRGADTAVLVDEDADACAAMAKNAASLGVSSRVRIIEREVGQALRGGGIEGAFDWIFVDPPYGTGALDRALRLLGQQRQRIAPGGIVIAEHDRKEPPADRYGDLALDDRRSYGQTDISFYTVAAATAPGPSPAETSQP